MSAAHAFGSRSFFRHRVFLALASTVCPSLAAAQGFAHLGPRSMGMAGAYVAVASDATAVYWNPAGVYYTAIREVRGAVGIRNREHGEFLDPLSRAASFDLGALQAERDELGRTDFLKSLFALAKENTGAAGERAGGISVILRWLGLGAYRFSFGSAVAAVDPVNVSFEEMFPIARNRSHVRLTGLKIDEYALVISGTLGDPALVAGLSAKYLSTVSYTHRVPLSGARSKSTTDDWVDDALHGRRADDRDFAVDLGFMLQASTRVRLGLVGRNLNEPEVKGVEVLTRIASQWRAGAAFLPVPSLTLAVDLDLSENNVGISPLRSREVAMGLEKIFGGGLVALRGGVGLDLEDRSNGVTIGMGGGFSRNSLVVDVGAEYRSSDSELSLGASAGWRF